MLCVVWVHGCDPERLSGGLRLALYQTLSKDYRVPFFSFCLVFVDVSSSDILLMIQQTTYYVCVCVFFPSILDIKFVGRTSRGHTGGRSHGIFNPPSFCGACLDFCREKDSAIPFPRRS